jgi:hypothetical protein
LGRICGQGDWGMVVQTGGSCPILAIAWLMLLDTDAAPNGSYAEKLLGSFEHLRMGDALTFAEQSCRSGHRLEFGNAQAIDCERISQKFGHEGLGATTRHVYSHLSIHRFFLPALEIPQQMDSHLANATRPAARA